MRFGIRAPLAAGLLLAAAGLALFARAPVGGTFTVDVLPNMILLGLGAGMALNPLLLAAMSDVEASEAGLASGVVNTSFMMGGALGLAVLASLAASRTDSLLASGKDQLNALADGYHIAFLAGALFAVGAAALSATFLRGGTGSPAGAHDEATQRPEGSHEIPGRTPGEPRDAERPSAAARSTG
jgi:MFS family permease